MHAFVANHFRVNAGKNPYTKVLIPSLFHKLECQNGPLTFLPRKKDATLAKLCRGPKNIKLTNLLWDLAGKPTPITFITSHKLGHFFIIYGYYFAHKLEKVKMLMTKFGKYELWLLWYIMMNLIIDVCYAHPLWYHIWFENANILSFCLNAYCWRCKCL